MVKGMPEYSMQLRNFKNKLQSYMGGGNSECLQSTQLYIIQTHSYALVFPTDYRHIIIATHTPYIHPHFTLFHKPTGFSIPHIEILIH